MVGNLKAKNFQGDPVITPSNGVVDNTWTDFSKQVLNRKERLYYTLNFHVPTPVVHEYIQSAMVDIRRIGGKRILSDKKQSRNVVSKLIIGLLPHQFNDLASKDHQLWQDDQCTLIAHFLMRGTQFAKQVHKVKVITITPKSDTNDSRKKKPQATNLIKFSNFGERLEETLSQTKTQREATHIKTVSGRKKKTFLRATLQS